MNITQIISWLIEHKWHYIVAGLPISIFLLIFYLRNKEIIANYFKEFILWAKPSLETNGKASTEKLVWFTVTLLAYIPCRLIFTIKIVTHDSEDIWHIVIGLLFGSLIDAAYGLLLGKIITPAQIIELKNGLNIKIDDTNIPKKDVV